MATVVNTTFRLKRGTEARWAELNPILDPGEPGFVYDKNRLKIGDGVTPWLELDYIGETELEQYEELKQEIAQLQKETNVNKLTQSEGDYLILYGGSAIDNI